MDKNTFPNGHFIGRYKGVSYYAHLGKIQCLFGWVPKEFNSIRAARLAITKWSKT